MKRYLKEDFNGQPIPDKVFLIGDLHGDWRPVRDFYNRHPFTLQKTDNTLICLGDFGAQFFFNSRDHHFKDKLKWYPFTYFIVRGNHEERPSICAEKNPDAWQLETYFNGPVWVEKAYPYIKYAMDVPTVYEIPHLVDYTEGTEENDWNDEGEAIYETWRTLVLPGAYSVDKYHRLQKNWSWFPGEQLTEDEMEIGRKLVEEDNKFDIILSHTCPVIFEPTDLFLSYVDQSAVDKTMERYLGELEYKLDYKLWGWGHYHKYREYPLTDSSLRVMLFNDCALDLGTVMARVYILEEFGPEWLKDEEMKV